MGPILNLGLKLLLFPNLGQGLVLNKVQSVFDSIPNILYSSWLDFELLYLTFYFFVSTSEEVACLSNRFHGYTDTKILKLSGQLLTL